MDDPAYKQLFSRPRMVEDLLHGFAARDWSRSLDFASLAPLPASYVSHDLRQRHGDLLLREQGDEELTQAFRSWVAQVLLPRRFRGGESGWLPPNVSAAATIVPMIAFVSFVTILSADEPQNGADRRHRGDETPRQIRLQVGQVGLRSELVIVCGAGLPSDIDHGDGELFLGARAGQHLHGRVRVEGHPLQVITQCWRGEPARNAPPRRRPRCTQRS